MTKKEPKFIDTDACFRTVSCEGCIYAYAKPFKGRAPGAKDLMNLYVFLASRLKCLRLERRYGYMLIERSTRGACGPTAKYYKRRA